MKTERLLLILIVLVASCNIERETSVNLMTTPNYYIGEIDVESTTMVGKEWLIKNSGRAKLKIDSIKISCDCLKVMYDSTHQVKPNGILPFRVLIPTEKEPGDFYREIMIYGNFKNSPLVLTLEGSFVSTI